MPVSVAEEAPKTTTTTTSDSEDDTMTATDGAETPSWGIHALPVDYSPLREYVTKSNLLFTFENEGPCAFCKEALPPGKGLYAVCPNPDCNAVGHVSCWSGHMLAEYGEGTDHIIPMSGKCPQCGGKAHWADMMKELTLRVRGVKEVEKLLKKPQKPKKKKVVQPSP